MTTPAVAAIAVGVLLVGVVLGWLWRGAICRRRHAHLTGAYEPAGFGTFFEGTTAEAEPEIEDAAGPLTPLPDGSSPDPAYDVKAKRASRIYHRPGTPAYSRTRADLWFRSADDAEAAGYRAPKQRSAAGTPPSSSPTSSAG